jgi:hypothetical protein
MSSSLYFNVHAQTASFGPGRRSRSAEILNGALLRLRFQPPCGLALNQNLPFVNEDDMLKSEKP